MVGIDVEWEPAIRRGTTTKASLLQVGNGSEVFLFDLLGLFSADECDECLEQYGDNTHGGGGGGGYTHDADDDFATYDDYGRGGWAGERGEVGELDNGSSNSPVCSMADRHRLRRLCNAVLGELLGSPDILVLGFGLKGDVDKLRKSYRGASCFGDFRGLLDLDRAGQSLYNGRGGGRTNGKGGAQRRKKKQRHEAEHKSEEDAASVSAISAPAAAAAAAAATAAVTIASNDSAGTEQGKVVAVSAATEPASIGGTAAVNFSVNTRSLSTMCESLLGSPLDKGEQCSKWGRRPLTASQFSYAALDAHCLVRIFEKVRSFWGGERTRPNRMI